MTLAGKKQVSMNTRCLYHRSHTNLGHVTKEQIIMAHVLEQSHKQVWYDIVFFSISIIFFLNRKSVQLKFFFYKLVSDFIPSSVQNG